MKRSVSPIYISLLAVFLIGLLSAGILSNPSLTYPGRDGGIFLYIGSLILKGRIPYLDVWENKGPLVFYINAFGLWLAGGSRWGVWLMEFLVFFVSGLLGFQAQRRFMGNVPALTGTMVWLLVAGNVLQGGNFSEEYSLLFTFLGGVGFLISLEHPRKISPVFLVGVTFGMTFLLRPNNISMQMAAAAGYFILAIMDGNWRLFFLRVLWFGLGALAVLAPAVAYFYSNGALDDLIRIVFIFNYQYTNGLDMAGLLEGLIEASRGIGWAYIGAALLGIVFSLLYWYRQGLRDLKGQALLLLVLGLPVELFLSALSGRNYLHYFIGWAPYVGLLSAVTLFVLGKQLKAGVDRFAPVLALGLIITTIVIKLNVFADYRTAIWVNGAQDYRDPVAKYIMQNTAPDDRVLVWGFRPIINFVTGRESPVSYLPYPLIHVDSDLGRQWGNQFYEQLTANPPSMIVNMIDFSDRERIPDLDREVRKQYNIKRRSAVLAPNWKDTLDFIERNYVQVGDVDGNQIYLLKPAP